MENNLCTIWRRWSENQAMKQYQQEHQKFYHQVPLPEYSGNLLHIASESYPCSKHFRIETGSHRDPSLYQQIHEESALEMPPEYITNNGTNVNDSYKKKEWFWLVEDSLPTSSTCDSIDLVAFKSSTAVLSRVWSE